MQLTNQKRLAAKILKCGENRVWINPDYIDEVASSVQACLLYTSPSPRDGLLSRMPSSA